MDVKLVMFKADGERREFTLADGVSVVGRDAGCELRVPLGEVSRRHAQFEVSGGTLTVKDLESSNGTYVNVKRVEEPRKLEPGDSVMIGPVVFTVQIDGEPKEIEPVRTRLEQPKTAAAPAKAEGPLSEDELMAELTEPMDVLDEMTDDDDDTNDADDTRLSMGDDDDK